MSQPTSVQSLISNRGRNELFFYSILAGAGAGLTAVAYRYVLSWAEQGRLLLHHLSNSPFRIALYVSLMLVLAFIVGKMTTYESNISGSGIPQVEAQLHGRISPKWLSVLILKFLGGALSLFAGLSLGREGPSIQLGAMTAQGLAHKTKRSSLDKKYLLICGACGGLAAAFNAPLAGVMFALEEIYRNFSALALFPAMLSALTADLISKAFFGIGPTLGFSPLEHLPFKYYPLLILVGVLCGVLGVIYNKTLLLFRQGYRKFPIPLSIRFMIPFGVAAALAFIAPRILGSGHPILEDLWHGHLGGQIMLALLVGKFLFSMLSFGSGAPGGIFFPLLVLGALAGSVMGDVSVDFLGLPSHMVRAFMLLGMAGLFSSIVRAPITGIILVVEMTGSITQLASLGLVACIATLTANALKSEPIYESLQRAIASDKRKEASEDNVILSFLVPAGSPTQNAMVRSLALPEGCLVVSIGRGEKELLPNGNTKMMTGDLLHIACPIEIRENLEARLAELQI